MFYSLTPITKNVKLGLMATSISGEETCPDTCPLKDSRECYGKLGPLNWAWKKVSSGKNGVQWMTFLDKVRALPRNHKFRHNQVGDLAGENTDIDVVALFQLAEASKHLQAYTYTHKPVLNGKASKSVLKKNREAIQRVNELGFTINISCDSMKEVDEACNLGIAPVVVVLPMDAPETLYTEEGNKVVVCPAQSRNKTCADCMLCEKQRGVVVGFRAHGTKKNALHKVLTNNK
jgi:hypothetical protein